MALLTVSVTGINTHNSDEVHDIIGYLRSGLGAEVIDSDLTYSTLTYEYSQDLLEDALEELSTTGETEDLYEFIHEVAMLAVTTGAQVTILRNDDVK